MRTFASTDLPPSLEHLPAWRPALVWALISAVAATGLVPYVATLLPEGVAVHPAALAAALAAQTGVMAFVFGWLGTRAGRNLGVGSPLLEALLRGRLPPLPGSLATAAVLGALAGLAIVGLDRAFAPWMPALTGSLTASPAPWQGLLASFYGGIAEEVLTRLGLATLVAWAVARVTGAHGSGRRLALALGVGVAALLFGALHLPAASLLWPLTPVVVARTLALNAVGGLLAGVLYVRRGLEHAIVAHFCADLVLHVLVPALSAA